MLIAAGASGASVADEARAEFDAGRFRQSLVKVNQALETPASKTNAVVRQELLALRGESLLRLKDFRPAAGAFRSAAKEAEGLEDPKPHATSTATALLIESAKGGTYRPTATAAAPVDIVDPASRGRAMAALLEDSLAAARPVADRIAAATSLPEIEAAVPKLRDLAYLERAVSGGVPKAGPLATRAASHMWEVTRGVLGNLSSAVTRLNDSAEKPVIIEGKRRERDILAPRGLNTIEQQELKRVADDLLKVEQAMASGRSLAVAAGAPTKTWDGLREECAAVKDRVQRLWDRRF
jgi:hypothetical protein